MTETGPASELIRAFIAAEISPEVRDHLTAAQAVLKRLPCRIGWVAPHNIHLTLIFLGDIFSDRLADVTTIMDTAATAAKPVHGEARSLGIFGNPRHPRVIWAGLTGNLEPLLKVQAEMTTALKTRGFYLEDRPFSPHLTLGRFRAAKGAAELGEALGKYRETTFGCFTVDRLMLMRSRLTSNGPAYETLHQAEFPAPQSGGGS